MSQQEIQGEIAGMWGELLQVPEVALHDNFFGVGGQSLTALMLIQRVMERFAIRFPTTTFLQHPTLARLVQLVDALVRAEQVAGERSGAEHTECDVLRPAAQSTGQSAIALDGMTSQAWPLVELDAEEIQRISNSVPGGIENVEDVYPLAPLQEGILFQHIMNREKNDAYVLPFLLEISSTKRLRELLHALQAVIDRYDVLRTAFLWEGMRKPIQVVYRRARLIVEEVALNPASDLKAEILQSIEQQQLDIQRAPLLRVRKVSRPDGAWYALLQWHHIVIDHIGLAAVISDLVSQLEGRQPPRSKIEPYRTHVANTVAYANTHAAEAFFRRTLGDVNWSTAPFGVSDVHGDATRTEEVSLRLDSELGRRIRAHACRLAVSPAVLFHIACALVIAATTGLLDVVFGSVLLGRLSGSAGAQNPVGLFINTLPLRLRLKDVTTHDLVRQAHKRLIELMNHEKAPLAVAQRCSSVRWPAPLFTVVLNYRHNISAAGATWADARDMRLLHTRSRTNYPITFAVDDYGNGFELNLKTDSRIDPRPLIGYMEDAVRSLVNDLEGEPKSVAPSLPVVRLGASDSPRSGGEEGRR